MVSLLVGADICPIEANLPYFESGDANQLFNDLLPIIREADITIANLECPLVETQTPIAKTGPTFGESKECLNAIKAAGINVLCLANNHIMDHGSTGLRHTLQACEEAGIEAVGAGESLESARKILIKTVRGIRVGILAVAEREFSIATQNDYGANPLDLIDFVRNVQENRNRFDYLLVLLHGSAEFHVPTPRIQNTCRFLIEMGANAVIVQHPHCLGGYETYRGGHIVYGQGAWIMDEAIYRDLKSFHEGFLVKLTILQDGKSNFELVPFTQSSPPPGARRMTGATEQEFRQRLDQRSKSILDPHFLEAEWIRFCDERKHSYMSALLGHNRVLRRLNKTGLVTRLLHGKRPLLGVRNIVQCETHREAIQTIFEHCRI